MKHIAAVVVALLLLSTACRVPAVSSSSLAAAGSESSLASSSSDSLASVERSLIFAPSRYPEGDWKPRDLKFEDAWFNATDGTRLHGWYVPHEQPRAVILFCHGNAGNVALWADEARILHDRLRVSVLLFDYRGFGRSEGKPSEEGVLADARAARRWLAGRTNIAEKNIVLMGRSLGGAVAVDLAANDGARGLVLESTFTSLPDVAKTMFPLLPVRALMQTRLNSVAKIANYHGPLLQSHGTADRLIPYQIGCRLFDAANQPKRFVPIPGGDHNDPQTPEYYEAIVAFLDGLK
ncbi:MAG: alpha/beta hydrolase [Planctomycetaceae bacterium]|nr:alpha/beta hydrolase [Planctomycetaceae bacterium]